MRAQNMFVFGKAIYRMLMFGLKFCFYRSLPRDLVHRQFLKKIFPVACRGVHLQAARVLQQAAADCFRPSNDAYCYKRRMWKEGRNAGFRCEQRALHKIAVFISDDESERADFHC